MASERIQVGSFGIWLANRLIQFGVSALAIWFLTIPYDKLTPKGSWKSDLAFVAILVIINAATYPVVYGRADSQGVSYRRFFRKTRLTWPEIASVRFGFKSFTLGFAATIIVPKENPTIGTVVFPFGYPRSGGDRLAYNSGQKRAPEFDWLREQLNRAAAGS